MSSTDHAQITRSYGCTFGCGNPYDIIVVTVSDGTTEMLCMPCFIKMATDMVRAFIDADDPEVRVALAAFTGTEQVPMSDNGIKPRGHNAPATSDDPDIIEAFDSVITVADLPPEFT